jgi:hypothetical protein
MILATELLEKRLQTIREQKSAAVRARGGDPNAEDVDP